MLKPLLSHCWHLFNHKHMTQMLMQYLKVCVCAPTHIWRDTENQRGGSVRTHTHAHTHTHTLFLVIIVEAVYCNKNWFTHFFNDKGNCANDVCVWNASLHLPPSDTYTHFSLQPFFWIIISHRSNLLCTTKTNGTDAQSSVCGGSEQGLKESFMCSVLWL